MFLPTIPNICSLVDRNVNICSCQGWEEYGEEIKSYIRSNDYKSLYEILTNPSDEYERYRVVSPLISILGKEVQELIPHGIWRQVNNTIVRSNN